MKKTPNKMYNFIIFFISQTVSELGTSMTGFATAIWVYSNSGQVMSASLLAICGAVPYLIVSLFGGAVVGLFICKRLMGLMNGEVYADICDECFYITLVVKMA